MDWLHLILLAIIQGLTEFLPISSSAHLILPAQIFGWEDQGAMIDLMAHFGTLFAVIAYFRQDVGRILRGFVDLLQRKLNTNSALALNLIVATPPAIAFGAFLELGGFADALRSPWIIATTFIVFGIVLWLADIWGKRVKTTEELSWKGAFTIGLAQCLALIPGTSRSGITMTAALGLGLTRVEAARFSMLMSLPIIGVGGAYAMLKLATTEGGAGSLTQGIVVAGLSFLVAYATIAFFMKFVSRLGMLPFMLYRVGFGIILLIWMAGT
ncbi:undecaprenyl-diphosphate phosphatase [Litorimonas sp. RW-G-Af-16]|uniref:undecaprenyl-diphosphate phosphatase n=1 Tax=Litorimonas sp. RW-G-Af-16 TaxID=3241168 RepID=UPI00390CA9E4